MVYVRVNKNINNTITEISNTPIKNLLDGEVQGSTNYDFPTSQPPFFYVMDEYGNVRINDEEIIESFYAEDGNLSGLDLEPHIDNVINGDFVPNTTKEIVIEGMNFSPFSIVEVSGVGNFINTIYFDSPKQIRASLTVNNNEGIYDLIVKNDQLSSKSSGLNSIVVKSKTSIDLRTTPIIDMGLTMTEGVYVEQDANKGIRFYSYYSSWNRGVKFDTYFWDRNDEITFEIIFTRISDVNFMVGIASANLNVNNINSAYYLQEIGMYMNNNKLSSMYGGGDVTNWNQGIGTVVNFDVNKFYKLKMENSGGNGSKCSIYEVDSYDWDNENILYSWTSNCPADDKILVPFVIPQAGSGDYYITGFRY